jgi:hypothetical protein
MFNFKTSFILGQFCGNEVQLLESLREKIPLIIFGDFQFLLMTATMAGPKEIMLPML